MRKTLSLLGLALVAFLLLVVLPEHAHAQSLTSIVRIDDSTEVNCTTTTSKAKTQQFARCGNGGALKMLRKLTIAKKQRKQWRNICLGQCLKTKNCVGFTAPQNNAYCQLYGNPDCGKIATKRVKNDKMTKVTLEENCFEPFYRAPTRRPTLSPIPACILPESNPFAWAFLDMNDAPGVDNYFKQIETSKRLCELVRTTGRSQTQQVNGFTCTLSDCLKFCYYSSDCKYVQYSAKMQTCMASTYLELTDDPSTFKAYHDAGIVSYMRNSAGNPTYYSGRCNEFVPNNCDLDKECGWNKGKRGINDQTQGGSANGWCGRISCRAATLLGWK